MKSSLNHNQKCVQHPLNNSKSKSSFSFRRSERFVQDKSFSPNKFYNVPCTLSQRASTIGFGKKTNFEKTDFIEPNRYKINSSFEKSPLKTPKFTTFGINREEYYKGRSSKHLVGPGEYQIKQTSNYIGGYMGFRIEPPSQKHTVSTFTYGANEVALHKLSIFKNGQSSIRMKTEYYPKPKLYQNDTHTPGPGSYYPQGLTSSRITKNKPYYFGKEQRIKKGKPSTTGPGSYKIFSQFG